MNARRILLRVHLIVGCAAAPLLALTGLTGAVLVFEDPIDHWLNRQLIAVPATGHVLSPVEISARLESGLPGYRVVAMVTPGSPGEAWNVRLASNGGAPRNLLVDPDDGRVVGDAGQLSPAMRKIHQFHTRLLFQAGGAIVGWGGVALVILALSGLGLWWPGKILRVHRHATGRRIVFELHSALGGMSWVVLLLLGLSGMMIHWNRPAVTALAALLGEPPPRGFPDHAPGCDSLHAKVPLANLVQRAIAAMPGARWTGAYLDASGAPARVVLKFPEDHTPAGRTNVFLSPCSGEIIEARSSRLAPLSYKALAMWNREIHTGDLWGWPTRILAALVSLSLPVMALTGPLIWWSRRKRAR